jgi:ABC-2 type transport system permease protein
MSKALAVAWREFRQTALTKMFLFAMVGLPLFLVAIMGVAVLLVMQHEEPPLVGKVVVADATGEVAAAARIELDRERMQREFEHEMREAQGDARKILENPGAGGFGPGSFDSSSLESLPAMRGDVRIDIEEARSTQPGISDELRRRINAGEILAAAIFSEHVINAPDSDATGVEANEFELLISPELVDDHTSLLERKLGQAVVRVRAQRAGLDPDEAAAMLRRPDSKTRRVLATGETTSEGEGVRGFRQMIPMFFMMLLWVSTFTAGQHLMMSTIEEKSNRVMEVLLSAVSPMQLMVGKILGHGAVGLIIVSIYTGLGIIGLGVFTMMHLINISSVIYLAVYFFMAYFMVATIFAAVGSAVSDIREANILITPVMIVMMVPFMLWLPISNSPNGTLATVCSFLPPVIPFAMILRLSAEETVPMWQIPATMIWGYLCVLGMVWMAAKIFRIGVLMYGKPPNPLELVKWLRYR